MSGLTSIEESILLFLQSIRNDVLSSILVPITKSGNNGMFWIVLVGMILVISAAFKIAGYDKRLKYLPMTVGTAGAFGIMFSFIFTNLLLKKIVARVRPYEVIQGLTILVEKEKDASFPSGHASVAFAASVAILIMLPKKSKWIGVIAVIYAAIIAFSRLYVGVHYPTDVLGGICMGTLSGILGAVITKKINAKKDFE